MKVLSLFLALISASGFAQDYHLVELDRFDFEAWKINDYREGYMDFPSPRSGEDERWNKGAAINFNLNLIRINDYAFYANNYVHSDATNKQFRTIGWQWETGFHFNKKVDLFWKHHSQHVLDAAREEDFPLENRYGIRLIFYTRE